MVSRLSMAVYYIETTLLDVWYLIPNVFIVIFLYEPSIGFNVIKLTLSKAASWMFNIVLPLTF